MLGIFKNSDQLKITKMEGMADAGLASSRSASRGSETFAQDGGFIQRERCSPAQMDPLR